MNKVLVVVLAMSLMAPLLAQEAKPKSDLDKVGDAAENIIKKPLEDANISKKEIPPILVRATKSPYSLAGIKKCADFKTQIKALTTVLGPDIDSPRLAGKGAISTEKVLDTAQDVIGSLIPYGGVVRALSGANDTRKKAIAAVLAGSIRRAYLKGWAGAKGCKL